MSSSLDEIRKDLKNLINKYSSLPDLAEDTKLFSGGIIDSLNFAEIIIYIQSKYKIKIAPFEIRIKDFDTIHSLSKFINKKMIGSKQQ